MTGDGTTAVGNFGLGGPAFRWTRETGVVSLNVPTDGVFTSISRNGKYISTNLFDIDTRSRRSEPIVGTRTMGGSALNPWAVAGPDTTYNYGVSNSGAVYGLAYTTNDCRNFQTFRWTPSTGTPAPSFSHHQTRRLSWQRATQSDLRGWIDDRRMGRRRDGLAYWRCLAQWRSQRDHH